MPSIPKLILASVRGFASDVPASRRAGYDFIVQAESGWMSITGEPEGRPMKVGVALADVLAALYCANGIQAALLHRERTGEAIHVEVPLMEAALSGLVNVGAGTLMTGQTPERFGNAHPNIVPYQSFACADGEVAVGVGSDRQFEVLALWLGLDLEAEPRAGGRTAAACRDRKRAAAILCEAASPGQRSEEVLDLLRGPRHSRQPGPDRGRCAVPPGGDPAPPHPDPVRRGDREHGARALQPHPAQRRAGLRQAAPAPLERAMRRRSPGLVPLQELAADPARGAEARTEARIARVWPLLVGPVLVRHTRLLRVRQRTLVLGCWKTEVMTSLRQSAEATWPQVQARLERLLGLKLQRLEIVPCDPPEPAPGAQTSPRPIPWKPCSGNTGPCANRDGPAARNEIGSDLLRGVAQPGRALGSGPRGRRFESSRPDQRKRQVNRPAFSFGRTGFEPPA